MKGRKEGRKGERNEGRKGGREGGRKEEKGFLWWFSG